MNIALLGAGSWAIALSVLLRKRKHDVRMWEFNPADAQKLAQQRELPAKLPGIRVPDEVLITDDIAEAVEKAEIIVCAVPAQTMRSTMKRLSASVPKSLLDRVSGFVIVAKGIETTTLKLMSDVLTEEIAGLSTDRIVMLSGPSHAEEVSRDIPTTVVAASDSIALASMVQEAFSTETFRIYTNPDLRGVELSGSVKNVIAIAAGMCDGLGFGDNTKAAVVTRGLAEITRLGVAMGAQAATFMGLSGVGDLAATCASRRSRNHRVGLELAQGRALPEILAGMAGQEAEGVPSTRAARMLAQRQGVEMPITEAIHGVLFEGVSPRDAVAALMSRRGKDELEEGWLRPGG